MMKKITFLFILLAVSLGYSQIVLEDFEAPTPTVTQSNGLGSFNIIADPTGGGKGNVLEVISAASGDPWQQANLIFQNEKLDLSTDATVSAVIYSTSARNILSRTDAVGAFSTAQAQHTGSGWETLVFNFAGNPDGGNTPGAGPYNQISFFPCWAGNGSGNNGTNPNWNNATTGITFLVDTVTGVASNNLCSNGIQDPGETGVDCGGTCPNACPNPPTGPPTTPPARAAANVVSIYGNAYMQAPTDGYQTFGSAVVSELDFMGNTILSTTTPDNGSGFQYQYFGTMPQFINLSAMTNMHIDFYFEGAPTAVGTVLIVIAQASDGTNIQKNFDVTALASSTWHEMDIPFASFDGNPGYARNAIRQVIVQVAGANGSLVGPFYIDNLYFHNNTTLGVEDFNKTSFSLYPNPTQNNWTVKTKNENMSSIKVFDILGKNVLSIAPNASEATIDGSGLKSGLYFAQIETEAGTSSLKLVKN